MTTSDENVAADDVDIESIQDKIDRLLQHAEHCRRVGEDHQADATLHRAQVMMLKYSIDAAVIAARQAAGGTASTEQVVVRTMNFTGIYKTAIVLGMHGLLRATGVPIRSFTTKGDKAEVLSLVGFESEVRQLQVLVTSIQLQAIQAMNTWWDRHPDRAVLRGMAGFKTRRQFVASFIRGATDRIEETRRVALGDVEPGTALVLRQRQEPVDAFVKERYRLTARRSNLKPGTAEAASSGRSAGRRANTGDTAVGGNRRQITGV